MFAKNKNKNVCYKWDSSQQEMQVYIFNKNKIHSVYVYFVYFFKEVWKLRTPFSRCISIPRFHHSLTNSEGGHFSGLTDFQIKRFTIWETIWIAQGNVSKTKQVSSLTSISMVHMTLLLAYCRFLPLVDPLWPISIDLGYFIHAFPDNLNILPPALQFEILYQLQLNHFIVLGSNICSKVAVTVFVLFPVAPQVTSCLLRLQLLI